MPLKVQKSFNWKVVLYLFFGGTGGGLFFIGFILERLNLLVSAAHGSEVLGPIFVLVGCFFLLLHAGTGFKTKIYLLFLKPGRSWISRGTWIISIFVLSAFGYAWFGMGEVFGWIALVFSLLMAIYPGFLLAENKAIPFWSTSILPTLFLFSGLSSGLAFLLLLTPFLGISNDETVELALRRLSWSDVLIIATQLIILWNYVGVSTNREAAFRASLRLFKRPLFTVGTLALGLVIPLLLHLLAITGGQGNGPATIAAILLIIGGICLRFSVVRAGVYLPRHSL